VDTVHQGDWDGEKGVYHINAVDTVTQWQAIGCAAKISEQYLIPVLEAMLHQFPFRTQGFHSGNGSEFIDRTVAKLLEKLLVEFTKSRAYRSQDNALVEGKNGAVIRKQMGYGHIPSEHAVVRTTGPSSQPHERRRIRQAHGSSQKHVAELLQTRIAISAALPLRARRQPSSPLQFQDHLVLETKPHFRIVIRLEMLPALPRWLRRRRYGAARSGRHRPSRSTDRRIRT
jgi:hypothetical protein